MDQIAYRECMKPYISGHHEDRKLSFCAGAKMCTGKASNLAEAEQICRDAPPKEPRVRGRRFDAAGVAHCMLPRLAAISTEAQLVSLIGQCTDPRIKKVPTRKQLIKQCVAERTINGSFAESVSLQKKCAKEMADAAVPAG